MKKWYLFKKSIIINNKGNIEYLSFSAEIFEDAVEQLRAYLRQRYPKKIIFEKEFKKWTYVENGAIF